MSLIQTLKHAIVFSCLRKKDYNITPDVERVIIPNQREFQGVFVLRGEPHFLLQETRSAECRNSII